MLGQCYPHMPGGGSATLTSGKFYRRQSCAPSGWLRRVFLRREGREKGGTCSDFHHQIHAAPPHWYNICHNDVDTQDCSLKWSMQAHAQENTGLMYPG